MSGLLKIHFDLITFYQCFECCKRGFALFHSIYDGEERWFIDSMSPPQMQIGFIVSLKPCLNFCLLRWLKPRPNLVNSFISYELYGTSVYSEETLSLSVTLLKRKSSHSTCSCQSSIELNQLKLFVKQLPVTLVINNFSVIEMTTV